MPYGNRQMARLLATGGGGAAWGKGGATQRGEGGPCRAGVEAASTMAPACQAKTLTYLSQGFLSTMQIGCAMILCNEY